jgi:hypothetical protein
VEDLLNQPHTHSSKSSLIKSQSKSLDDIQIHQQHRRKQLNNNHVSNTTRTEMDLSGIGCNNDLEIDEYLSDNEDDQRPQRSQSAPVSPTKIYDKELAAFIQCEQQQQQQQLISDSFIYNIDLSDTNETSHQPHSRTAIFFVSYSESLPFKLTLKKVSVINTNHKRNALSNANIQGEIIDVYS